MCNAILKGCIGAVTILCIGILLLLLPQANVTWCSSIMVITDHSPQTLWLFPMQAKGFLASSSRTVWSAQWQLCTILNNKTVWLFIIIITNWDVDVLIAPRYWHAPKCRVMYLSPLQACFAVQCWWETRIGALPSHQIVSRSQTQHSVCETSNHIALWSYDVLATSLNAPNYEDLSHKNYSLSMSTMTSQGGIAPWNGIQPSTITLQQDRA